MAEMTPPCLTVCEDQPPSPAITLWLDPGLTTGWAYLTTDAVFKSGELGFQQLGTQLEMDAYSYGSQLSLGWENFIITPSTAKFKDAHWAMEVIGMARYIGQKHTCTLLPAAPPSARNLGSLRKLKQIGWYYPGRGHANDAASHLLAWYLRQHLLPTDLLEKVIGHDGPSGA